MKCFFFIPWCCSSSFHSSKYSLWFIYRSIWLCACVFYSIWIITLQVLFKLCIPLSCPDKGLKFTTLSLKIWLVETCRNSDIKTFMCSHFLLLFCPLVSETRSDTLGPLPVGNSFHTKRLTLLLLLLFPFLKARCYDISYSLAHRLLSMWFFFCCFKSSLKHYQTLCFF